MISCPITTLPIIRRPIYLYTGSGNDFTWLSLGPTVWLVVASHISIITTVIPSLKGVFDSWLGNTFGINIDSPYQLERIDGKDGFEVSAFNETERPRADRTTGYTRTPTVAAEK